MRVALIGCGKAASLHAEVYKAMNDVRLFAIADSDYNKAKLFAEKYNVEKIVSDYSEILEDKSIDFIDICTPTSSHAEISCNVAKSGHHILLEKPMALNVEECSRIINESKKNQIKLCLVHNLLFLPAVELLKKMVNSGRVNVASIRTSYKIPKQQNDFPKWVLTPEEKGILWELGYHLAYLQLEFLKDVREIHASARKIKFPVCDKISAFLSTSKANYGILEVSTISKQREFIIEIDSDEGTRIKVDLDNNTLTEIPETTNNTRKKPLSTFHSVIENIAALGRKKTELSYSLGLHQLINAFIKSLKSNSLPPVAPEEGRNSIILLSHIEKRIANCSDTKRI